MALDFIAQPLTQLLEMGQKARNELLKDENDNPTITPCQYKDAFKPYDLTSVPDFFADLSIQFILNPAVRLIVDFILTVVSAVCFVYHLLGAIGTVLNLMEWTNEDEPLSSDSLLLYAATDLFGIPYFALYTVVDPLWEVLAGLTRTIGTVGLGVYALSAGFEECCLPCFSFDETNNGDGYGYQQRSGSATAYGNYGNPNHLL